MFLRISISKRIELYIFNKTYEKYYRVSLAFADQSFFYRFKCECPLVCLSLAQMDLGKITFSDHLSNNVVIFEVDQDDRVFDNLNPFIHQVLAMVIQFNLLSLCHHNESINVIPDKFVIYLFTYPCSSMKCFFLSLAYLIFSIPLSSVSY